MSIFQFVFSIKIIIVVTCTVTFTPSEAQSQCNNDLTCTTPDDGAGYCIPLRHCKPIMDATSELRKSQLLIQNATEYLKKFICGFDGNLARVCCPFASIVLPRQGIISDIPEIDSKQNLDLLPLDCGMINEEIRIYGGNKTALYEFPWMALLTYDLGDGSTGFRCGGTIINKWYVLTAAHCLAGLRNMKLIGVRLGEHDIRSLTDCEEIDKGVKVCAPPVQNIGIGEIIPHAFYNGFTFVNDIGLIRLASPIDMSRANSKPICLPTPSSLRSMDPSGNNFTVTGWGLINLNERSPELLKVTIPAISETDCRKAYENSKVSINSKTICAGTSTADACGGDSGGPLQKADAFHGDVRYVQHGIVSSGPSLCGNTRTPGVYTRIGHYLDWILDNLKP